MLHIWVQIKQMDLWIHQIFFNSLQQLISFTLWQQTTCRDHSSPTLVVTFNRSHVSIGWDHTIIACSHHMYLGFILRTHPVRGESHIQGNTTGELQQFRCDECARGDNLCVKKTLQNLRKCRTRKQKIFTVQSKSQSANKTRLTCRKTAIFWLFVVRFARITLKLGSQAFLAPVD